MVMFCHATTSVICQHNQGDHVRKMFNSRLYRLKYRLFTKQECVVRSVFPCKMFINVSGQVPSYCRDNSWISIVSVDAVFGGNWNCSGQKLNYGGNATHESNSHFSAGLSPFPNFKLRSHCNGGSRDFALSHKPCSHPVSCPVPQSW